MAHNEKTVKVINDHGPLGFVFFTAFVGAFIYFLKDIQDFGDFIMAFLQACVWPGIVIYHVLQALGA
ncbi:MAG TPA: hypothetical protein PL051_02160 [Candidatus Saccharibacteria bacterium]|nr:hypothetical protein [Candidatus Saccharibacteria bacterium]